MINQNLKILTVENISFSYGEKEILKNLSFSLDKGEIAVFLGRSGAGKTTFIKLLAGLEHPTTGTIKKYDQILSDHQKFVPPNKRNIGVVFQEDSLFPHLTILENIKIANNNIGSEEIEEYFNLFQLKVSLDKYPHQLSGGQKQRVATIRALAQNPDCILFDEPFSALDYHLRIRLRRHLKKILKERGISAIFITHDREEALLLADQIFVMNDQKIIQHGEPKEIMENPANTYVANFLGAGIVVPTSFLKGINNKINSDDTFYFFNSKKIQFSTKPSDLSFEGIMTEKNINSNNSFHYYFKLNGMDKEFGPIDSNQQFNPGEKFYLNLPNDLREIILLKRN